MSENPPTQTPAASAYAAEWSYIVEVLSGIYTPREVPEIAQWVHDCDIKIPSQHNRTRAGEPFDFDLFPCMSGWIFDFVKNPSTKVLFSDGVERVVENRTSAIMKDSQSTASTCALMCLAWLLTFAPGNVIMIIDNRQQARDFAKDRLDNVLDQFRELKGEEIPGKSTSMAKRYKGGTLYLGGGQSSSELVSKPAAFGIADEVAKHDLVNEMPTLKLLEGRGTGDDAFRLLAFSTPDRALEHQKNEVSGVMEPVVTKETILHSSYLQGTRERCEVPCPHCGAFQELVFERLVFEHCLESLPEAKPEWNLVRVQNETWYRCINPDCTDRHPDGTVRGKIEEHHKAAMVKRHRFVGTNPRYKPGHRTMQIGALINIAFLSRRWGAIAVAFLTATKEGGEANMKAFWTEFLGIPFARYQQKNEGVEAIRRLRRTYRRISWQGVPTMAIPLPSVEVRFLGMTADVQRGTGNEAGDIGFVEWLIFAAGWDGQMWVLDWGIVPALESLVDLVECKVFTTKDGDQWDVGVVVIDTGYRKDLVYAFLAGEGGSNGSPRWVGIRGRDVINDKIARVKPRWKKEYPAQDRFGRPTTLRVINLNADHWEHELHVERIAKAAAGQVTRPPLNLPADISEEDMAEITNMEQYYTKPDKGNIRVLRWRKRHAEQPNNKADLIKYGFAVIDAVEENEATQL